MQFKPAPDMDYFLRISTECAKISPVERPGRDTQEWRTDASPEKGGDEMVTYIELFAFCTLIVSIIKLVLDTIDRRQLFSSYLYWL